MCHINRARTEDSGESLNTGEIRAARCFLSSCVNNVNASPKIGLHKHSNTPTWTSPVPLPI